MKKYGHHPVSIPRTIVNTNQANGNAHAQKAARQASGLCLVNTSHSMVSRMGAQTCSISFGAVGHSYPMSAVAGGRSRSKAL